MSKRDGPVQWIAGIIFLVLVIGALYSIPDVKAFIDQFVANVIAIILTTLIILLIFGILAFVFWFFFIREKDGRP